MPALDTSTDLGAHVAARLERESLIWLTTVGADGTPQPTLVWFLWTGSELVVRSRPDKPKLRNIARNPRVALNLESNEEGNDVAVLTGAARVDPVEMAAGEHDAFHRKYADGIDRLGSTYATFADDYSVTVRITPEKLRGWK